MSSEKQNPFVNLAKAAVGLPVAGSSCCGSQAKPSAEPAAAEPDETAAAAGCGCDKQAEPAAAERPASRPRGCCG